MLPLVLLVDDFEDGRAMYAEFLVRSGYRVVQATDGKEAVQRARALLPDVVVMDLTLPVWNGLRATRELKADARTRTIPVVALTGRVGAAHARDARAAGCDGLLTKPCLPGTLLETIRAVLGS